MIRAGIGIGEEGMDGWIPIVSHPVSCIGFCWLAREAGFEKNSRAVAGPTKR